ncbi:MAG TPA: DUF2306 domain-containing protein [Phenylobacterium sp.]|nr:DUF2306 domain-containing protein [Phenylobacterium sp.]
MSHSLDSTKPAPTGRVRLVSLSLAIAAGVIGVAPFAARSGLLERDWTPHAPDLAPLLEASLAIQIHVAVVLAALAVGLYLLFGPKGRRAHRVLGWAWAIFMLVGAVSSLFIMEVSPGSFSFIHLFSLATLISVPLGVYSARRHRVNAHRRAMTGVFIGGLLVAGSLSFLPGRLMWQVFFA